MQQTPPPVPAAGVEVFWRPGCPYCARLHRDLRRRGVPATWRDIWADPAAAAIVRDANGGAETVPTVRVGDQILTNPRGAQVVAALAALGGHAAPAVTASLGQTVIAHSSRTIVVEGNHYFPIEDVQMRHLTRTRAKSLCPWKGVASYYTVSTPDGRESKNAAWTYRHPSPLARRVKHRIAFWGDVHVQVEQPPHAS